MRTYAVKLSGGLRANVERPKGDVLDLMRDIRRGHWLKDTDGEYLNPAHVISVQLKGKR